MAQDVISTLFGITPRNAAFDKYTEDRMIDVNKAGSQYADLGRANIERASAMMQNAGTGLGIGIGRLLGGQTPQMAEEQRVQGMLGGASLQDPEQLMMAAERFAQAGDIPRAQALQQQAQVLKTNQADLLKKQAEAAKAEEAAQLEKRLRAELAALPANATPEQVEGVVLKYGDPDKILNILQKRQDKELTLKAQEAAAKQAHLDRLELARQNNASREQIAAMNRQFQQQLLAMRQVDKQQAAKDKKDNKVLPTTLQVKEDEDFAAIDTAQAAVEDITPIISTLKNGQLNLSGFGNMLFKAKAAIGSDDPEVLKYQALQRQLTRFINSTLQLNKGVQTEGDAQRAANELNAAFSANNSTAMQSALEEMVKVNQRAATSRQNSINRRRKSQGISPATTGDSVFDAADAIINGN